MESCNIQSKIYMKPYHPQQLPLPNLDWEAFVDLLGKAHATLAHFDFMTKDIPLAFLLKEELKAQRPIDRDDYKKMLIFSRKAIRRGGFSSGLICKMHQILKKGSDGKFRHKQNWIGPKGCSMKEAYFYPPPFEILPEYMENLRLYSNKSEKDPLVHLAIYFAQLLIIHPFMDGNGRIARAIIPLFLYKKGIIPIPNFYLSAYFKRHRLDYFEQLYLISAHKNWEGWIRFFLQAIIEEGERIIRRCRRYHPSSSSP